ncbi:MAG TPA: TonB family protein [Planctomycetota bacterium]|jgi:protein TonB|nr:TonB family protein [Planctomycetota bacterium]
MKLALVLGVVAAAGLFVGDVVIEGVLFPSKKKDHGTLQQVELLSDADAEAEKPPEKKAETKPDALENETEQPPDGAELAKSLDQPIVPGDAPALEAASLSAIEAALNGQGAAGGDFADALSFSSGGRIGGMGKAGALEEQLESAFSMSEIDQKPRPIFQTAPVYPSEMRGKSLEGVVTVIFVVDSGGKVSGPRVEKSSHPEFDKPALDAVKQWKFEPAVKGGQRVACKMRVPIRFQPS